MKTIIFISLAFWLAIQVGQAQKHYEKGISNVKKVLIEKIPGKLLIKQSTDNLFRIETDKKPEPVEDDRAEGLKPVTGNYDNTGLGLALIQAGSNVTISGPNKFEVNGNYTIYLPPNVEVSVDFANPFSGESVEITGLSNPIEAKTLFGKIKFSNITGPAVFHSISGDIEGSFSTFSQEAPSSITSVSGLIDIALPNATPAEVSLVSVSGKIYTGFDIEREKSEKKDDGRAKNLSQISGIGQRTNGNINGGGTRLMIQSISGNIYLRNK
jgi:lia operon protein LiaG